MNIKKISRLSLAAVLSLSVVMSFPLFTLTACKPDENPTPSLTEGAEPTVKGIWSDTYYVPSASDADAARRWREGYISGNGENGVVTSGVPYSDTFIFQNMSFTMPNAQNHDIRESVPDELAVARQKLLNQTISEGFTDSARQYYYSFHPGHQLRVSSTEYPVNEYKRWTDYTTAEVGVSYSNRYGIWTRTTFTSREDNVTITAITQSSQGKKVSLTVSIDNVTDLNDFNRSNPTSNYSEHKNMEYKKLVDENLNYIAQVAHYPDNVVGESAQAYKTAGYAGLTQIVVIGGSKEKVSLDGTTDAQNVGEEANPAVKITDAEAVYLITQSDRTFDMGAKSAFASATEYEILDELYANTNAVAQKYTQNGKFDYDAALEAHVKLHKPEYEAVTLDLNAPEADRELSAEALIDKQRSSSDLLPAFTERSYYAGRYAQICSSGYSTQRLGGMWTGDWYSSWGAMYTVDANVNLQVSAMNTGNLTYTPLGYISFILRLVDDWMTNAETVYGMHDAIQASHNTDGDSALMIQSDNSYPFQYWNAGASWLLYPIYEYWQCYGNRQIPLLKDVDLHDIQRVLGVNDGGLTDAELQAIIDRGYMDLEEDILLPLLTKQSNFWEQLCTPEYYMGVDGLPHYQAGKTSLEEGERYLIIPSMSPENSTGGSMVTINSTMDISAAKSGLEMTIELEKAVNGEDGNAKISRWQTLIENLPEYQYTSGGALKEWATDPTTSFNYAENNSHRHLSHLYCAWPLFDIYSDEELYDGVVQALKDRTASGLYTLTQGHGWIHATLVATRLRDSSLVYTNLKKLATSNIYYYSMMTDHNTDRGSRAYCTDTLLGTIGVVNESLVYSNTGEICVLPTLISGWETGSVTGIRARTRAEIDDLSWNTVNGTVTVKLTSDAEQTIKLSNGLEYSNVTVSGCEYESEGGAVNLSLKAGDTVTVTFVKTASASASLEALLPSERRASASAKKLSK